jgi:hypothetical protein
MNDDAITAVPPTVTLPLASLTRLLTEPDGWIEVMTLSVLMAASY